MNYESTPAVITRIGQFFRRSTPSGRRRRSGAGLLLALVLSPLLLGVLACLPVPVGDPEKSHIDADLSGAWRAGDPDEGPMVMVLDPYDKRTWLMTLIDLAPVGNDEAGDESGAGPETSPRVHFSAADAGRFEVEDLGIYKCWLTRIKGENFMTWESKTLSETAPGDTPETWWVFRVRKNAADTFYLDNFDYSIDGLDKVKTRKEAEKIIRRHLYDPAFFDVEDALKLQRMSPADFEALSRLLDDFGLRDEM